MIQHRRSLSFALAIACSALPQLALADAKSDLNARYAQLETAMDTREPEQIQPLLTPDFSVTDIGGRKQDLAAMLDRIAMIPVDPDHKELVTIDSVDVHGDTAEVLQHRERSGTRKGRDGKQHSFAFTTASHDTWVQSPKGWLLKASEAESITITRDGQVMRTMKKGVPMPPRGTGQGSWGAGRRGLAPEGGEPRPGGAPSGDIPPPPSGDDD